MCSLIMTYNFYIFFVNVTCGVLKVCYPVSEWEPENGELSCGIGGWKDAEPLSLREAAKKQ